MRRRALLLPRRAVHPPTPTFRSRPSFLSSRRYSSTAAGDLQFGQPLHETHPHIIKPGDLTPGISALEYHLRRAALTKLLPENSVAVLAANDLKYRSGPVFYEFHQEPNFFYLTGFNEPEAVAVIEKGTSDVEYTFHLLLRPKHPPSELWEGARSGLQAALDIFNADEAGDVNDIATLLPPIVKRAKTVYTDVGSAYAKKGAVGRFFAGGGRGAGVDGFAKLLQNSTVKSLRPLMNRVRLSKSRAEVACMRRAGQVSGAVLTECMKRSYSTEKQLWADLAHGYRAGGLDGEAYVPVVAGGKNALSIHYVRNDADLREGEMVLVDAGGQYGNYITDITRTWPINGRFTAAQRDLYAMVLAVQKSCLSLCREDANMTLDKLHSVAENGLRNGLKDLGFDTSRSDCLDTLFPHHVGHYIGLDVHDAPGYPRTERLMKNHCITIEPGIYVPVNDERWPAHFRGMGVRIEDSVRVGMEEVDVLTDTAVKDVEEIEGLRG